ncbi:hypothetical protein SLEP1_g8045 [Rubroshorea leprosula]|uniref:Scarecrow-like protein 15 n=1 Tax=Rubroshorea leprosula TaxID=152421 RepID=A0AAV5IA88_9ROSI|nr:hypothetical protein SLEP1_g8045 [Rubroshorea leprosula]
MRVPATTPPQDTRSATPKPVSGGGNNANNLARNINFHEPTSVLDLRRSPSPVPAADVSVASEVVNVPHQAVEWDERAEHALRNVDWDSIMRDLGWDDDSAIAIKSSISPASGDNHIQSLSELGHCELTHSFHQDYNLYDLYNSVQNQNPALNFNYVDNLHNLGNFNVGFDFIEELIRAADCFDSNQLQLAQLILARLNQRLRSPVGKPLQRAAFYFKEALQSLLTGSTRASRLTWDGIVQTIRAYRSYFGISPIPMFTHFTTNQAILDALEGSQPLIHIIDFDIGLGMQYASLMRDIAEKSDYKFSPPVLRISAVVPEEFVIETRLIKENLTQFAHELKIRFQIEFVPLPTFEMLLIKAFKFTEGEKLVILLSPAIFRCMNLNVFALLSDLRRVSPSVVVFVDTEVWMESGTTSFRRNFVNGLEFYAMMLESLDAAAAGGDWAKKIEMFLMRPRILAAVETAGRRAVLPWREIFCGAGMRPVQLSQFADFQAECLLGKVQVRGFHVGKRQAELVLCWHERVLVATSAWRC